MLDHSEQKKYKFPFIFPTEIILINLTFVMMIDLFGPASGFTSIDLDIIASPYKIAPPHRGASVLHGFLYVLDKHIK